MEFVKFSNEENIEVKDLDDQHKKIALIINDLHHSIAQDNKELVRHLLNNFVDTSKKHFDTEENYMKKYNFLHFYSHKLEHDRFLDKIKKFRDDWEAGDEQVNLVFLNSCKKWFFNHIEMNDRKTGKFLNEQGVS